MKQDQLHELLYQMLETEMGGVQVYETALRCVQNDELKEEWEDEEGQLKRHGAREIPGPVTLGPTSWTSRS